MTTARTIELLPRHRLGGIDHFEEPAYTTSGSPTHHNTHHADSKEGSFRYSDHDCSNVSPTDNEAVHKGAGNQLSHVPSFRSTSGETPSPDSRELEAQNISEHLSALMKSPSLSEEQKLAILTSFPASVLGQVYERHVAAHGPPQVLASTTRPQSFDSISEDTYLPLAEHIVPSPNPEAPPPIYPGYAGHFTTSEQARRYRKRARLPPKAQAPDVARVRRYGRKSSCNLTVRHN